MFFLFPLVVQSSFPNVYTCYQGPCKVLLNSSDPLQRKDFTQSSLHSPSFFPNQVDPNHWPKIQFNISVQLAVPELLCNLSITNSLLILQLIIHGDFSFYYHVLLSNFLSGFIHSIVNIVTVVAATSSVFSFFFSSPLN